MMIGTTSDITYGNDLIEEVFPAEGRTKYLRLLPSETLII